MALIVVIPILIILVIGGIRLRYALRGVNLKSVAGALVAMVIVARYAIYTALVFPAFIILNFSLNDNPENTNTGISAPFKIVLHDASYGIQGEGTDHFNAVEITDLTGMVQLSNPDSVVLLITVSAVTGLIVLMHFILINAQAVLKSLHDRNPFLPENPAKLRKMATLGLLAWLVYVAFTTAMTLYLQSQLNTENIELLLVDIQLVSPLFMAGLVFVLAEVFRVGFELKQENELTV